jgi:putative glutamine amidotransferase
MMGLMPAYIEAIREAGGIPVLVPLGASEDELLAILDRVDGVLLPGGGDINPVAYRGQHHKTLRDINPERDRVEIFMARQAVQQDMPVLAICRGHQMMNVALGGSLWEDIADLKHDAIRHDYYVTHPRTHLAHSIQIEPESHLANFLGQTEISVNSLHHQGVKELAAELVKTAVSPDGLVEAVELPGHPFAVGVQWHPENLIYEVPPMLGLFKGLVHAANGNGHVK